MAGNFSESVYTGTQPYWRASATKAGRFCQRLPSGRMQIFQTWGVPLQWTNKAPSHHAAQCGRVGTGRVVCPGLSYRHLMDAHHADRIHRAAHGTKRAAGAMLGIVQRGLFGAPALCMLRLQRQHMRRAHTHTPAAASAAVGVDGGQGLALGGRHGDASINRSPRVCALRLQRAARITSCAWFSLARGQLFSAPSISIWAVWRGPAPATTDRPHAP